jgi:dihydrofolate synthase/folylpolyglutamate synthase
VIETGLGGRLDATNVVQPLLSVLTQISLDHTEILGPDLASIAGEKAGIVKRAVPVISAPAAPEVEALLRERCARLAAPLWIMDRGRDLEDNELPWPSAGFERLPEIELSLAGAHQRENAALCVAALGLLGQADGIEIEEEHVQQGLARVRWPGRLEWIGDHLLDGAHNPSGCRALARALPALGRGEDYCLVLGAIGQRDLREMIRPLEPMCGRICLTRPKSARAAEPARYRIDGAEVTCGLEEALSIVEGERRPKLIAGSLYLVGEARALLLGEPVDPWPTGDPGVSLSFDPPKKTPYYRPL